MQYDRLPRGSDTSRLEARVAISVGLHVVAEVRVLEIARTFFVDRKAPTQHVKASMETRGFAVDNV